MPGVAGSATGTLGRGFLQPASGTPGHCAAGRCCSAAATARSAPWPRAACRTLPAFAARPGASRCRSPRSRSRRCVFRCRPSTRHDRRSLGRSRPRTPLTCSTARRRFAGLGRFPMLPRARSPCRVLHRQGAASAGRSPAQDPSAASPGRSAAHRTSFSTGRRSAPSHRSSCLPPGRSCLSPPQPRPRPREACG
jgi:hypothetical protein